MNGGIDIWKHPFTYNKSTYTPMVSEASKAHLVKDKFGIGWITNLETLPEMRGQGHATRLVSQALEAAKNQGIKLIQAIPENKASARVFQKNGFRGDRGKTMYKYLNGNSTALRALGGIQAASLLPELYYMATATPEQRKQSENAALMELLGGEVL